MTAYSLDDLAKFKSRELLPLECEQCTKSFVMMAKEIKRAVLGKSDYKYNAVSAKPFSKFATKS